MSTGLGFPVLTPEQEAAATKNYTRYQIEVPPQKNPLGWLENWTGTPEEAMVKAGLRQASDKPGPIRACCGEETREVTDSFRKQGYMFCPDCRDITNLIEP